MRLPGSEYWEERGNHPFPTIGVVLAAAVLGGGLGLGAVFLALVFAPDDLIAAF